MKREMFRNKHRKCQLWLFTKKKKRKKHNKGERESLCFRILLFVVVQQLPKLFFFPRHWKKVHNASKK